MYGEPQDPGCKELGFGVPHKKPDSVGWTVMVNIELEANVAIIFAKDSSPM